jgi:hypothetical protein
VCESHYKNFFQNQIYAQYSNIEIYESLDYLDSIPNGKIYAGKIKLQNHSFYPIKNFTEIQEANAGEIIDPYSSLTASLSKTTFNSINLYQINFSPLPDELRKKNAE